MSVYRITRWNTANIVKMDETTRRSRTGAADVAWRYARNSLEAFGKLDTIAAHRVRDAMANWDDLLPMHAQRSIEISNTGHSVTIIREA